MGVKKKDVKLAPTLSKTQLKPLATQLRNGGTNKKLPKRPAAELITRPFILPQYEELLKEDRDIVLDRLRKEVVDASAALPAIKSYIVRGVNHVSRLIATRELRVVVFATNPDASTGAFAHIPLLCRLHRVPICVLRLSSKAFGSVFQQSSLAVLGIKRLPKRTPTPTDAAPDDTTASDRGLLGEVEYEKLQSITEFLVSKASAKNHSHQ